MKLEASLNYFKKKRNKVQIMEEECAIYALEKQIFKKPIINKENINNVNYKIYMCPCCKKQIIKKIDRDIFVGKIPYYCDNCGQALDWSDLKE
ncbi:hypothetical protein [Eubacterium sp.]